MHTHGEKLVESRESLLLATQEERKDDDYKCPLSEGDLISFSNGSQHHVVRISDRAALEKDAVMEESSYDSFFKSDPQSLLLNFGDLAAILNSKGEAIGLPCSDFRDAYYQKTARSKMLAPMTMKVTSLVFQISGIISAGYAICMLSLRIQIKTWSDFKLAAFLFSQHSAAITLTVATAQVAIFALYSSGRGERAIWSAVFLICCIEGLPCAVGIIVIGWYGLLVYCILPFMFGMSFVLLAGTLVAFLNDPLGLMHGPGSVQYDCNLFLPELKGYAKDIYESYHSKGLLGQGCYQVVVLLPSKAALLGFTIFLTVAYVLIALLALPPVWILLCGFAALPASIAIILEVIFPLLLLGTAASIIAYKQGPLLGRSGPSMILVFALSQLLIVFVSLLVPASILAQEANFGLSDALPLAYSNRHSATYAKAILNSFDITLIKGQETFEDIHLANATMEKTRVAISQLVSLIT